MSDVKLKECPFCKAEAYIQTAVDDSVVCSGCGVRAKTVELWNRRVPSAVNLELRGCLRELIAIQDERLIETPFEYPAHTYNEAFGGGECPKYGRYYGVCHSCDKDMKAHYETIRRTFAMNKETKLTVLAQKARALLAKGGV